MNINLPLSPKRVALVLLFATVALAVASAGVEVYLYGVNGPRFRHLAALLDSKEELNIPTWFESMQFLLCAALLAVIALGEKGRSRFARHWGFLAFLFVLCSIDETAAIHERLGAPLRGWLKTGGPFYYAWTVPGLVFVALLGIAYLRFLLRLAPRTRALFILAAATFVAGAVGLEMVCGWYAQSHGDANLTHGLVTTAEELLEMLGLTIFSYALLAELSRRGEELRVGFQGDGATEP